jgi:hypothetical protein
MRGSVAGGDDSGFQMEESPVDLLIDPDDALVDELDLAHEPLGHHVEMEAGLGSARGDLRPEFLAEARTEFLDVRTEFLAEARTEFLDARTEFLAGARTEFLAEVRTEVLAEALTEFTESSIEVFVGCLVHATTLSAAATAVKCIVRATPGRATFRGVSGRGRRGGRRRAC